MCISFFVRNGGREKEIAGRREEMSMNDDVL